MTPQELDAIVESIQDSTCLLCATAINSTFDENMLCLDCAMHVKEDTDGLPGEPMAEKFVVLLGLNEGCHTFVRAPIEFTDEITRDEITDRFMIIISTRDKLRTLSVARQDILWARYCALYICHTADFLVAHLGAGPLVSFDCFVYVLSNLRGKPLWNRFLLSSNAKARSGDKLALVVAEQFILHAAQWERTADLVPRPPLVFTVIYSACAVLADLLITQADKSSAVHLPEEPRLTVMTIVFAWLQKWPDDEILSPTFRTTLNALTQDTEFRNRAREYREHHDTNMQKCARDGCTRTEDLYQCERQALLALSDAALCFTVHDNIKPTTGTLSPFRTDKSVSGLASEIPSQRVRKDETEAEMAARLGGHPKRYEKLEYGESDEGGVDVSRLKSNGAS